MQAAAKATDGPNVIRPAHRLRQQPKANSTIAAVEFASSGSSVVQRSTISVKHHVLATAAAMPSGTTPIHAPSIGDTSPYPGKGWPANHRLFQV